jgi:dihydroneopterin aldolase
MGKIAIEGMKFYAYHGYYAEERRVGNHFEADVYVHANVQQAAESDDLQATVNYEVLWELTRDAMQEPSFLLEQVALRLYRSIRARFPGVAYCKVRIAKLHPPIQGEVARTYVEVDEEEDPAG